MLISIFAGIVEIPTRTNSQRFPCLLHEEHILIQKKTAASESNVNRNLFAHHENIVVITGLNNISFVLIPSFIKRLLSLL